MIPPHRQRHSLLCCVCIASGARVITHIFLCLFFFPCAAMSARGDRNGITNPLMPTAGYRIEAPSSTFTVEQQLPFVVIDQEKYFRHYQAFFNLKGKCIRAHTHLAHTRKIHLRIQIMHFSVCSLTCFFFLHQITPTT